MLKSDLIEVMLAALVSIRAPGRRDAMMRTRMIVPAALLLMLGGQASADDLTEAAQGLCASIKSCALEQVAEEDLTPEMLKMMEPMLDNMCASMRQQVQEVPVDHKLYKPAVGCLRSLESMTCEQMQNADQVATPECEEYERLAKEQGVKQ